LLRKRDDPVHTHRRTKKKGSASEGRDRFEEKEGKNTAAATPS
jgi:hypothetical protein